MKPRAAQKRRRAPTPAWAPPVRKAGPELDRTIVGETRARLGLARWGLVLFLSLLSVRAAYVLGTPPDAELLSWSRDFFNARVETHGQRGALLDRAGRLLAYTVELPTLYANPKAFPAAQLDAKVPLIAAATGRSEASVRALLTKAGAVEVKLGDAVDPDAAAAVLEGLKPHQAWAVQEPIRMYPGKATAAPLVGYTDAAGAGAAGLEKVLEKELRGRTYRRMQDIDRRGDAISAGVDAERLASAGNSVRLTVDLAIQHAAERALEHAVIASRPESATAVVMDVHDGSVLAVASWPAGNPNDGNALADQSLFKNHAAMDQIEPGSVLKPFVAAAALEEGLFTPEDMIDCELGAWAVSDRTIRDDHPKGVISLTEVIKYSSNIGTAKLAFKLGAEKTLKYLSDFGFARSTGLGLPGEVPGSMRKADTIRDIELATTAFGQGMTASPVQLAAAVAALANDGVRMKPRLVDAVLNRSGHVESLRSGVEDRRVVSESTARAVNLMMETVTEEGGTGTRARVPGYRVAGKTGTAQKVENGVYSPTKRVGSFVGFLPADRPEIAVAVMVDTPTVGSKYGGIVAAPVFAEIGDFTMKYLGIPADPPGSPSWAPPPPGSTSPAFEALARAPKAPAATTAVAPVELVADGQGGWILPDLAGRTVRAALAAVGAAGFDLAVEGQGRLVAQFPPPGTPARPGDRVVLHFN